MYTGLTATFLPPTATERELHRQNHADRFLLEGQVPGTTVFKATDCITRSQVALKFLSKHYKYSNALAEELSSALRVAHVNVVRVYDLHLINGESALSMEWVDGCTLRSYLQQHPDTSLSCRMELFEQVCKGLEAIHRAGVVHGDLTMQNVLVARGTDGTPSVKIIDFGLAHHNDNDALTSKTTIKLVDHGDPVTVADDIYRLGALLFQLLTDCSATHSLPSRRSIRDPRHWKNNVPLCLARLTLECWNDDPKVRLQSTSHVIQRLARWRRLTRLGMILRPKRLGGKEGATRILSGVALITVLVFLLTIQRRSDLPRQEGVLTLRLSRHESVTVGAVARELERVISQDLLNNSVWIVPAGSPLTLGNLTGEKTNSGEVLLDVGGTEEHVAIRVSAVTRSRSYALYDRIVSPKQFGETACSVVQSILERYGRKRTSSCLLKPVSPGYAPLISADDLSRIQPDIEHLQTRVQLYTEALTRDSSLLPALIGRSNAERMLYQLTKRENLLELAERDAFLASSQCNGPEVNLSLGLLYVTRKMPLRAMVFLLKARTAPGGPEAVAKIFASQEHHEEAARVLHECLDRDPYNWHCRNLLGVEYLALSQTQKAVTEFRTATTIHPRPDVQNNLGAALLLSGDYRGAIGVLEQVVEQQPTSAVYSTLGLSWLYLGRPRIALALFQRAVELDPHGETWWGYLAESYEWVGDRARAQTSYHQAAVLAAQSLRADPFNALTLCHAALYHAKCKRFDLAHQNLTEALKSGGPTATLLVSSAVISTLEGHRAEAVSFIARALENGFPERVISATREFSCLREVAAFRALGVRFPALQNFTTSKEDK